MIDVPSRTEGLPMKLTYALLILLSLSSPLFAANSRIGDDEYKEDGTVYNRYDGTASKGISSTKCITRYCGKSIELLTLPVFESRDFNTQAEKIRSFNSCAVRCGGNHFDIVPIERYIQFEQIIKDCELSMTTFQRDYYQREHARLSQLEIKHREYRDEPPRTITNDTVLIQKDKKAALCEDVRGGIKNQEMLNTFVSDLDACMTRYKTTPSSVDKLFVTSVQLTKDGLKKLKRIDNAAIKSVSDLYSRCLTMTNIPSGYEIRSSSRFSTPKAFEKRNEKPTRMEDLKVLGR